MYNVFDLETLERVLHLVTMVPSELLVSLLTLELAMLTNSHLQRYATTEIYLYTIEFSQVQTRPNILKLS